MSREAQQKPRGSDVRKSHTAVFKAKIIKCQSGVLQYEIAAKYKHKKLFAKQRPARKYLELHPVLFEKLKDARGKGLRVKFNCLWSKDEPFTKNDDGAIVKKHVTFE